MPQRRHGKGSPKGGRFKAAPVAAMPAAGTELVPGGPPLGSDAWKAQMAAYHGLAPPPRSGEDTHRHPDWERERLAREAKRQAKDKAEEPKRRAEAEARALARRAKAAKRQAREDRKAKRLESRRAARMAEALRSRDRDHERRRRRPTGPARPMPVCAMPLQSEDPPPAAPTPP